MFSFEPSPNIARRSQIFQVWIRPVEPVAAAFTLRLAVYELDKLVKEGIPAEDFARAKEFLTKYVNVLTKTKNGELGYAMDSLYYGIGNYNSYVKDAVAKLTREQVNAAIRKHLRADKLQIVAVAPLAEDLRRQIVGGGPSLIDYNSPKPAEILAEDKVVGSFDVGLRSQDVESLAVERVFE